MEVGEPTDSQLVDRCRAGEEQAWVELVDRYARYVHAIARQAYRLNQTDAEDVFQEVFARAYEHLDELRDAGAVKAWLAQLARRLSVDRLRASSRERPSDSTREPADSGEMMERLDQAIVVHEALARLPGHCREIVDRFFARDESYATISEALDIPEGTIASRISRCLAKLRTELTEGR